MIGNSPGYPPMGPGMTTTAVNSMRNKGYISLPVTYNSYPNDVDIMQTQKNFYNAGFRGLGDVTEFSSFDPASLLAGGTGTLLLVGGVVLLLVLFMGKDKRKAKKEEMNKAREKYKQETRQISAKYGKLGLGL